MKNQALAALATLALAACTHKVYVEAPQLPTLSATPGLQECANHATLAQKAVFGDTFNGLMLNTRNLVITAPNQPVGAQAVGAIYDGEGEWFGPQDYRRVHFHCMLSPAGQVVYSFVRAQ